jgi:hypothetical protein
VALSTTKAEYVAACAASREAMWLRKLLSGLFGLGLEATDLSISRSNITISGIWYRGEQ